MRDWIKDLTDTMAMALTAAAWTVYQLMKISLVIIALALMIGLAL